MCPFRLGAAVVAFVVIHAFLLCAILGGLCAVTVFTVLLQSLVVLWSLVLGPADVCCQVSFRAYMLTGPYMASPLAGQALIFLPTSPHYW